jgi:RNA polymerase sigma-70 factor (ECF subfamily)
MQRQDWLAERFEESRGHLRGVAYRMLGSLSEADDAVQEAWLRLSRSETEAIENLGGWLTTVVSRVCLDILRSRKSRREESMEEQAAAPAAPAKQVDPESEAVMADSVGVALLVVLDRLTPAERLAFVLHDMFAVPFEEIGPMVNRTAAAARQLASRARRRVQGARAESSAALAQQRETVAKFLRALKAGDIEGLVAVLDPQFVGHVDEASMQPGVEREVRGAEAWARQSIASAKGARAAHPALVDGVPGVLVAPRGSLLRVLRFTFAGEKIAGIEVIGDPAVLSRMELAVMD